MIRPEPVDVADVVRARDERAERQRRMIGEHGFPLVSFTMNIAGEVKRTSLSEYGFDGAVREIRGTLGEPAACEITKAKTGDEALFSYDLDPDILKSKCVALEESLPGGRLLDVDVIGTDGVKISRREPRKCLVCGRPAAECARSRAHGLPAVKAATLALLKDAACRTIARSAEQSLLDEARLTPKPGLVDRNNSGANNDMDLPMLERSAEAISPYFADCARVGMEWEDPLCGDGAHCGDARYGDARYGDVRCGDARCEGNAPRGGVAASSGAAGEDPLCGDGARCADAHYGDARCEGNAPRGGVAASSGAVGEDPLCGDGARCEGNAPRGGVAASSGAAGEDPLCGDGAHCGDARYDDARSEETRRCAAELIRIGKEAEQAMFSVTGGVNTHKGAIYAFGIVCAALGHILVNGGDIFSVSSEIAKTLAEYSRAECEYKGDNRETEKRGIAGGEPGSETHGQKVARLYGAGGEPGSETHGQKVARLYGAGGARAEAVCGFADARAGLEALRASGGDATAALLAIMSVAADTNVLYRAGEDGLAFVQAGASRIARLSGADRAEALLDFDRELIDRNINPGGSADMLALALFFYRNEDHLID